LIGSAGISGAISELGDDNQPIAQLADLISEIREWHRSAARLACAWLSCLANTFAIHIGHARARAGVGLPVRAGLLIFRRCRGHGSLR
jgi:hypothetical protein